MHRRTVLLWGLMLALIFAGCSGNSGGTNTGGKPANAIEIALIYAPESDLYMPNIIAEFNRVSASGTNPVTGQAWGANQPPVWVVGQVGSSGTVAQGIVNAFIAPNNANVARPVIFQPSVSHWLALVNFQAGREVFNLSEAQPTALAPVVMAIWESRLQAIQQTVGYDEIGWEELVAVLNSPNGWQDYGLTGRRTVYYGHTDPFVSSTAISTLIAEFYAGARLEGYTERRLTMEMVRDEAVQQRVRDIESLIRHYSSRTTEFKEYIAQGPEYLDFVALEENDLIFINRGLTEYQPPERLVALYPKEGTFWHEHPFGIVNANWVTPEQQNAARIFTEYVLMPVNQQIIMEQGFRPANPDVPLAFPFVPENGVTVEGPSTVLAVPDAAVIAAVQESWAFVKKQADILLLIDVSGSMLEEGKLEQAKQAAALFIDNMEPTNRVGLAVFNETVTLRVPLDTVETNAFRVKAQIESLRADGGTALYDAIAESAALFEGSGEENRIRAIVLLSDGADTASSIPLADASNAITASRNDLNPLIVIPVAYGQNADIQALNSIARASATRIQSGGVENILGVLEIISSYF